MTRGALCGAACIAWLAVVAASCAGSGDAGGAAASPAVGSAGGVAGVPAVAGASGTAGTNMPHAGGVGGAAGAASAAGAGGSLDAGSDLPDASAPDNAGASGAGGGGASGGGADAGSPARVFSTDRDDFFGAPRCAGAGVMLCEDFESEQVGQGPDGVTWSVPSGDPRIDATRAARGSQSLHLHTEGNGWSVIEETVTFPAPNDTLYGRMFVWIDALPTAPQWAHWTLVAGNGRGDGSEIRIGGQWDGNLNRFGVGSDHGATGDWTNLDGDPQNAPMGVHEDEWMCLEWMYKGDSSELRFYWDGVEHPSLYASASEHGGNQGAQFTLPTFERLALGWWLYQGGPTPDHYDVWIDEIVVDDERIGCVL